MAWCMCVITGIATAAFYKWNGVQNDWLIGLTVSFVILTSIAFAVLSFLGAVAVIGSARSAKQSDIVCVKSS